MSTALSQQDMKDLIKQALLEIIEERRDLIHDVLEEALEDIALARAIEEGKDSGEASRDEVFAVFEDAA